jgi:N-methylhydantoinase A
MGMLAGDVERYFLQPLPGLLHLMQPEDVNRQMAALREDAVDALAQEGYSKDRVSFAFEIDLRFRGQDSEVPIALPATISDTDKEPLRQAFLDAYRGIYGYASSDSVETVNIRLRASGITENRLDFAAIGPTGAETGAVSTRRVYLDRARQWVETPVRSRSGFWGTASGPLILESPDTTIVIPARATISADRLGNLVAELH